MKRYVSEKVRLNSDGERLVTVEVTEIKPPPRKLAYIIFINK